MLYLILESDWDGSQEYHIDLWTGSNTQGGGQDQIDCENKLPGGQLTIINGAPDGLPVDTTAFYDGNTCHSGTTYPVGDASSLCSGGSSGAPDGGSSVSQPQPTQPVPANNPSTTLATMTTALNAGKGQGNVYNSGTSTSAPDSSSTPEASCSWVGHCLGLSPNPRCTFQGFANGSTR